MLACFGLTVGAYERSEGVAEECSEQSRNGATRANGQTEALRDCAPDQPRRACVEGGEEDRSDISVGPSPTGTHVGRGVDNSATADSDLSTIERVSNHPAR